MPHINKEQEKPRAKHHEALSPKERYSFIINHQGDDWQRHLADLGGVSD